MIDRRLIAASLLAALAVGPARAGSQPSGPVAGPSGFVETFTASGMLDGQAFTDAVVTITAPWDGQNWSSLASRYQILDDLQATVTVSGTGFNGSDTIVDPVAIYASSGSALISDTITGVGVGTDSTAFAGYQLLTPIGPIMGAFDNGTTPGTTVFSANTHNGGNPGGTFILAANPATSTFMTMGAVPEPPSIVLMGFAAAGGAASAWVRHRSRRRLVLG
jgi:hypothetical protein